MVLVVVEARGTVERGLFVEAREEVAAGRVPAVPACDDGDAQPASNTTPVRASTPIPRRPGRVPRPPILIHICRPIRRVPKCQTHTPESQEGHPTGRTPRAWSLPSRSEADRSQHGSAEPFGGPAAAVPRIRATHPRRRSSEPDVETQNGRVNGGVSGTRRSDLRIGYRKRRAHWPYPDLGSMGDATDDGRPSSDPREWCEWRAW